METPIFISFLQNIHLVGSDVDLERHPEDGDYQDVTFLDPELYHNPEIIKTMMFYNKLV